MLKFEKSQNKGNEELKQWFQDHLLNKFTVSAKPTTRNTNKNLHKYN